MPRPSPQIASAPERGVKATILKVSTRLFARRGYSGTSLQAIVDEVGIRKPSLLYHFPSKEALREAVLQEMLQQWHQRLPRVLAAASARGDRLDALFGEVVDYFGEDPNRARLFLREAVNRPEQIQERLGSDFGPWIALLADAIESGRKAGTVRADVDPEAWLMEILILVIGTYAIGDLMLAVFPEKSTDRDLDRQMREIIRMARTSLFPDNAAARATDTQAPEQTRPKEATHG